MRAGAEHLDADGLSRGPGLRRRRAHDAVAGADRRSDSTPRARPLPGLSCRDSGELQHLRTGRGRLSHAGIRLAIDLFNQYPAWSACRVFRVSHPTPPGRSPPHHVRCSGSGPVHLLCRSRDSRARTGAAHGIEHAPLGTRAIGVRASFARSVELAGTYYHLTAHPAAPVQAAVDLAGRRDGRLSWRGAGFA